MTRRISAKLGCLVAVAIVGVQAQTVKAGSQPETITHLTLLTALEGSWRAQGDGFSSTLTYDWALPGVLLRVRNELRNGAGDVIGRYEGHYAWDHAQGRIVFWTVGRDGELHQGTVAARDGHLWHEARVSGGRIDGYRSVVAPVREDLHYRAVYQRSATDEQVLGAAPLIYHRTKSPVSPSDR